MSIKNYFTSRWGEGSIVEYDFGQLEVIGLAILSKDGQLKEDIRRGLDLHSVNTATLYNVDYEMVKKEVEAGNKAWASKRRVVKIFSFQLQYGAGARTMAENAGVDIETAQSFINAYYDRYPRVKEWQEETIKRVNDCACFTAHKSKKGFPVSATTINSPTGRMYKFYQLDAPGFMADRGEPVSFSPTQIKNYPVQGFSTGDIVPLALGRVYRYLLSIRDRAERIKFINTVHDSLIFDVHPDCNITVLRDIKTILESLPRTIQETWPRVGFDLPLTVGVEMGHSWGTCKPVSLGD